MTSKDKTSDQLIASVRKSKTGQVAKKTAKARTQRTAPAKPAKAPVSARNTTTRVTKAKPKAKESQSGIDPYTASRRVWPD